MFHTSPRSSDRCFGFSQRPTTRRDHAKGRQVLFGYRNTTEVLPELPRIQPGASIRFSNEGAAWRPVAVGLPIRLGRFVCPKPDGQHVGTTVAGAIKRIVAETPPIDENRLLRFSAFVGRWCEGNLVPLSVLTDTSVEHWLNNARYPAWRKDELRAVAVDAHPKKKYVCKSFIKDEFYPEFKHARTINPRDDEFKVLTGPIFALIEREVFKLKWFIKKVPVADRPGYIMEHVFHAGSKYWCTDYSSFENSFTKAIMDACEMQLYSYMTSQLESGREWFSLVRRVLTGPQTLHFKNARVKASETKRMSGDMCTSLGNGFTNLMVTLFLAEELRLGEVRGVFEGDDGLTTFSGGEAPPVEAYASLGFNIKMEPHDDISHASFCGLVFDENEKINITDPAEFLATFGWTSKQYLGASSKVLVALLRSKAMSAAHQYPGSPIISVLAKSVLNKTRHVDIRRVLNAKGLSLWERNQLEDAYLADIPDVPVGVKTRELMEKLYGITVAQQLQMEEQILAGGEVEIDNPLWYRVWSDYSCPYQGRAGGPMILPRFLEGDEDDSLRKILRV